MSTGRQKADREALLEIAGEIVDDGHHVDLIGRVWTRMLWTRADMIADQLRAIAGRMEGEATNDQARDGPADG